MSLPRRIVAEGLGTAFLLAVVIGSGIMGERLAGGISRWRYSPTVRDRRRPGRAHLDLWPRLWGAFQPAVTLAAATQGVLPWREVLPYIAVQVLEPLPEWRRPISCSGSRSLCLPQSAYEWRPVVERVCGDLWLAHGDLGCVRQQITAVPYAVAAYITSAYWFTASTSFANPAVTIARAASNTFAGIRPDDVAAFVVAQLLGAAAATWPCAGSCPHHSLQTNVHIPHGAGLATSHLSAERLCRRSIERAMTSHHLHHNAVVASGSRNRNVTRCDVPQCLSDLRVNREIDR